LIANGTLQPVEELIMLLKVKGWGVAPPSSAMSYCEDRLCPECGEFIFGQPGKIVVGFANDQPWQRRTDDFGNIRDGVIVLECPKCYAKCWCHITEFVSSFISLCDNWPNREQVLKDLESQAYAIPAWGEAYSSELKTGNVFCPHCMLPLTADSKYDSIAGFSHDVIEPIFSENLPNIFIYRCVGCSLLSWSNTSVDEIRQAMYRSPNWPK
jgi:hypothetical protein